MDDVGPYAGMHNTDTCLASLVICPVCPLTDGTEPKMRPGTASTGPAEAGGARPGRAAF